MESVFELFRSPTACADPQQAADDGAAKLAAGESVDLHQVMINMESANLSFGLALQVRNKLLDAYQEVMRMSV